MKKILLASLALLLCVKVFSQTAKSNVILFTENGERFFAILNGQRMNDQPVTNLKVQDLNQPNYALKVIFENKTIGEMNKTLYVESGVEAVYAVKLDNKGKYKLAFRSSVPIAQAAAPAKDQQVVFWGIAPVTTTTTVTPAPTPVPTSAPAPAPVIVTSPQPVVTGTSTTITEHTVTTTTSGTGTGMNTNMGTGTGDNINMNVTADGFGMNVNINGTGLGTGVSTGTTVGSSTTTTTTTTTTVGNPAPAPVIYSNPQPVIVQPAPCTHMGTSDFNSAIASIKAKSFEDSKMTLAKQITSRNCLDAAQVKAVMECFGFESGKLDYAKYAYDFCWEKNNYYKVNDAFDFESSIEELDEYIKTR